MGPSSLVSPPTSCPTVAQAQNTVDSLLPQLFGPGGGRRGKAQGYDNNIQQARRNGNTQLEQTYDDSLVNFTLQTYYAGNLIGGQSTATQDRVLTFIYTLYCASGISPIPDLSGIFGATNTVLIRYGTPTTVVSADTAAVQVPQHAVPNTIFGTFVSVFRTDTPLPTSLDWYGIGGYRQGAFEFVANPAVTFDQPVLTGVCISYDPAVVTSPGDLRLAHAVDPTYVVPPSLQGSNYVVTTAGGRIEIGARVATDPLGLACSPLSFTAGTAFGRLLQQFARLVLPNSLLAAATGGSTGSQVVKFSPFAAVDTKLVTSFTQPTSPVYIPAGSDHTTATVTVTTRTRRNTAVDNIPVTFTPSAAYAPSVTATDLTGTVSSAWTLTSGSNSGTGTPAMSPLSFSPSSASFSVNAVQLSTLSVTTTSLPTGQQGTAYSTSLVAAGGDGTTYAWSLASGTLPAGITLSSGGSLGGTPTGYGVFNFTVQVASGPLTATQALALTIQPPPVVISTTSPLPGGQVNSAYTQSLAATGGTGTYAWTVGAGSTLPAGLSLSTGGALTGTPTAYGAFNFTVRATSGLAGNQVFAEKAFALTIQPAPVLITTTSPLTGGQVTTAYSQAFAATGGTGSYAWTLASGSSLPSGLSLSTSGLLNGTPTAYGSFNFTIRATSGPAGNQVFTEKAFALTIQPAPVVITTTSPLPGGQLTTAYGQTFAATGGTGSFVWALATGSSLPGGLSLSGGGVLSGTPTAYGAFNFTLRATSGPAGNEVFTEKAFALDIQPAPVAITTSSSLPSGTIGAAYSTSFAATGGLGSYTWSLASGSTLPPGLSLSTGGVLSGTPTALGPYGFTIQASSGTQSGSRAFSLSIINPTAITLTFDPAPSKSLCYAVGVPMTPGIRVKVTDQAGNLLTGVPVSVVAVTNNGSKVEVTPASVLSGAGYATFGGPTINKTGGYALVASTGTPWPAATLTSAKFTISPGC
jgi:hypothetical protein